MSKLSIIKPASTVEEEAGQTVQGEGHKVLLARGVPIALDGIRPVVTIQVTDPERDASWLLRAAEQLLPLYRKAPGVVILDESDAVLGIIARSDLERAVLQMRRGDYEALRETLGSRTEYKPIPGDLDLPFVYWRCPECGCVRVPTPGKEDAEPELCRRHDPPVQMERRVHSRK